MQNQYYVYIYCALKMVALKTLLGRCMFVLYLLVFETLLPFLALNIM